VNRPTRRHVGWAFAAGLACAACCVIELGLLGASSIGAEFTEFAFLAPLLALGVLAAATVIVVRRRRRNRTRTPQAVPLPIPQIRRDTSAATRSMRSRAG
jgi:predicted lysophospholipase L1 biosynthesis ABC-type transport system permease subunit